MVGTVLYPEWVIDGTGAPPLMGYGVLIRDQVIEAVGPREALRPRPGDHELRFDGMTLLPGLINNHVHLNLPGEVDAAWLPWLMQSDSALALHGAGLLARTLRAGITTVRDCGSRGTTVLDLSSAQAAGLVPGSRVIACGVPLTITGGHGRPFGGECDGEDGVRRVVRQQVSIGAQFIKVLGSGGGTPGSLPDYPSFSPRELAAIVETAHSLGRKVTVHCTATAAIANAVDAGVDGIEHATFGAPGAMGRYDPEVGERLAAAGIDVTTTLQVYRDMAELSERPDHELWVARRDTARRSMAQLRELGVPLLAGSDAGWRATSFTRFWRELDELVVCGMSPVEAVHAATGGVARALGIDDRFGLVQADKTADLVVVQGDLSSDIRCLQVVRAVFQDGQLVHGSAIGQTSLPETQ